MKYVFNLSPKAKKYTHFALIFFLVVLPAIWFATCRDEVESDYSDPNIGHHSVEEPKLYPLILQ